MWRSKIPLSNGAAAKHYAALSEGPEDPNGFDSAVYAFYSQLIDLYPRLDMLSESEQERSPWALSPEFSGVWVSIALLPTHYAEVFPMILHIAEINGLVCYDSQNVKVHLPSCFEVKRTDQLDTASQIDVQSALGRPAARASSHEQPRSSALIEDSFLEAIAVLTLAPFTYRFLPAGAVLVVMGLGLFWSAVSLLYSEIYSRK